MPEEFSACLATAPEPVEASEAIAVDSEWRERLDGSDEASSCGHNGFDWLDNLSVLVLAGIIAVAYGLISSDWEFTVRSVLGCALGIVVVAAFNRLRRVSNWRRGAQPSSEQRRAGDTPPNG